MKIELHAWQNIVKECIDNHVEYINEQGMQQISLYERNKRTTIRVKLPNSPGHTTLAAFLAVMYDSVLIYSDIDHFKDLEATAVYSGLFDETDKGLNNVSKCISVYHLSHDLYSHKTEDLEKLKMKFDSHSDFKVTIVDDATSLLEKQPNLVDWLYNVSPGPIVLLN